MTAQFAVTQKGHEEKSKARYKIYHLDVHTAHSTQEYAEIIFS
jgi:hypothetical protein